MVCQITDFYCKIVYSNLIYYDNVLINCFQELFINYYPKEDNVFYYDEYKIGGRVMKKYSDNKNQGLELLKNLIKHKNNIILGTALILLKKLELEEIIPQEYLTNLGYHTIIK